MPLVGCHGMVPLLMGAIVRRCTFLYIDNTQIGLCYSVFSVCVFCLCVFSVFSVSVLSVCVFSVGVFSVCVFSVCVFSV